MGFNEDVMKRAVLKLSQGATWIKLMGYVQLFYGILTAIALVGILFIWLGLVLIKAANNIKLAQQGNDEALVEATANLSTYFTVMGILTLIGIIIGIISLVVYVVIFGFAISQGAFSNM